MRRKLIAANWKMHKTRDEARAFAEALRERLDGVRHVDLAVFPPFFAVPVVARALRDTPVIVGAQDLWYADSGAFTGEVSPAMVRDAGAGAVIVGHSERRHVIGESDELVARKLEAALDAGLVAVLCVGERLEEREAGRERDVVGGQLEAALAGLDAARLERVVVAYEPVWAIGTGRTATPEDAEAMHAFVRAWVSERFGGPVGSALRIQYGGSVKPANAAGLLQRNEIDGALVGGASLEVDSFVAIAAAAPGDDGA